MDSEINAFSGPWSALRSTLHTDRWARWLLATLTVTVVLYLLPVLSVAQRALMSHAVGPLVFLGLVVAALASGLNRLDLEERRFWHDIIAGHVALLASATLFLLFPRGDMPLAADLAVKALYAVFYAALALAAERLPHRACSWRQTSLERALALPAILVFVLALFAYFIIIPLLADPAGPEERVSGYALFLTLDVYLTARFLWLALNAGSTRWRTLYLVLGLTAGTLLLSHLPRLSDLPMSGGALDLLCYLPYLAIILARSRHCQFQDEPAAACAEERPETHFTRSSGRTMMHALALALLHSGGYSCGLLAATHQPLRGTLVFWVIMLLATIAMIQHRRLEKKARELWRDREQAEASLRRNEKDLRMMVERYHTDQKLRLSEEKLAKVFRVCPDAMMITSMIDGQIKEINDRFELITGYCREDILGKTVSDLSLWGDPEQRKAMIRILELEGAVRDLEIRVRTRSGSIRTGLLSVEKLNIDGDPHMLSVTHDITERKRIEEKLKTQAILLDKAQDAIAVLGLDDRITYWNRSAERLYGWSAAEAVGCPAAELLDGEATHQVLEAARRVDEKGDWIGEMRQVTKDGKEIVVDSWWTLMRDSEGNPQSKLVVSTAVRGRGAASLSA